MASEWEIQRGSEELAGVGPLARNAGLSKTSAEWLERALRADLETNIAPIVEGCGHESGVVPEALSVKGLASTILYDRASLAHRLAEWSNPIKAIAAQFALLQAGRTCPPTSGPTALLMGTVSSPFGKKAHGSNTIRDMDRAQRRGLVVPMFVRSSGAVPVAIQAPAEDIDGVGFAEQVIEHVRTIDRSVAQLVVSPSTVRASLMALGEEVPPSWRLPRVPRTLLVPAGAVGGEIPGTGAPRWVNADADTLRELVPQRAGAAAKAAGVDEPDVERRALLDRIVIEVEEPLRDVEYLDPKMLGRALGWTANTPFFQSLSLQEEGIFYALEHFEGRTLLHRAIAKRPPEHLETMGGRRTTVELIGFELEDVTTRARRLETALFWSELMSRRGQLFAERMQEVLGDLFTPALSEANKELQRECLNNMRLIEFLAMGCF